MLNWKKIIASCKIESGIDWKTYTSGLVSQVVMLDIVFLRWHLYFRFLASHLRTSTATLSTTTASSSFPNSRMMWAIASMCTLNRDSLGQNERSTALFFLFPNRREDSWVKLMDRWWPRWSEWECSKGKASRLQFSRLVSMRSCESVPLLLLLRPLLLFWLRLQELMADKNHVNFAKSPRLEAALSPHGLVKCHCAAPVALAHFTVVHLLAPSLSPLKRKEETSYYGIVL